jgi:hypothetical protein
MTSNLVSAARAVLNSQIWDSNCDCTKCKSMRVLESAVILDRERRSADETSEVERLTRNILEIDTERAKRIADLHRASDETSVLPHLDTCGLKNGGSRCTCGLTPEEPFRDPLDIPACIHALKGAAGTRCPVCGTGPCRHKTDHAAEVHKLNNDLTTAILERTAAHNEANRHFEELTKVTLENERLTQKLTALTFLHYGARPEEGTSVETTPLPHASGALKDFMSELGEIMSMEDRATPADYLQRARDIRQRCGDDQGLSSALNSAVLMVNKLKVFGDDNVHRYDVEPWLRRVKERFPDLHTSKDFFGSPVEPK